MKKHDCYKCKGTEFNEVPFLYPEFIGTHFYCKDCGHKMTKFKPRDPERQRELNEAVAIARETLPRHTKKSETNEVSQLPRKKE